MTFKAAPLKTALSDTYPNPSNAVMRTGMGALWDWATSLLGTTGDPADARTSLIAAKSGANSDITSLNALASINGGPLAGMRNRIINGDMRIDQRNAGAAISGIAAGTYCLDRWVYRSTYSGKFNVKQNQGSVTPPAGFTNYLGITVGTAYTPAAGETAVMQQRIEGLNFSDLSWGTADAEAVTLSGYIYTSIIGNHSGAIYNSANNRGFAFTIPVAQANTWTKFSVTIPGDTAGTWAQDTSIGAYLSFNLGSNADSLVAAGAWGANAPSGATGSVQVGGTLGATFYLTGVQLEASAVQTPFERRSYGLELSLCERYYERNFFTAFKSSEQIDRAFVSGGYKTTKRAIPTLYFYGVDNVTPNQVSYIDGTAINTVSFAVGTNTTHPGLVACTATLSTDEKCGYYGADSEL